MNDSLTTVTLSWRVNSSYNSPVINYQLEFQELPDGQWIVEELRSYGYWAMFCRWTFKLLDQCSKSKPRDVRNKNDTQERHAIILFHA